MNRGLAALLGAQFLTAFADNAILFTAIAIVLQHPATPSWYISALQSAFLVAFVVLAPWTGALADRRPKAEVLLIGNLLKGAGTLLFWLGVEPILAYGLVGMGAALYSPAKYGILPEMVPHGELVKANGWVEGSTIVAIIAGTVIGARLADHSIGIALLATAACYGASLAMTAMIPRIAPSHRSAGGVAPFLHMTRTLLASSRARFAMLGTSLFWAVSAVLRLALVAWAPLVLHTAGSADIADLILALALGLVAGSVLVPSLIPIERLHRARLAAYAMSVGVVLLSLTESVWPARAALGAIGLAGGLFVVPVNAALQEIGHRTVGSGGVVAAQNGFENLAMMVAVGLYAGLGALGVSPTMAILGTGLLTAVVTGLVSWHLPGDGPPTRDHAS